MNLQGRFKLGRAVGIDVFIHWTFVFAPLVVIVQTWHLGWHVVSMALVLLLCFFACVLLHEFGHSLVGRFFGVRTQDIVITPIGGLARLHGLSRKRPVEELLITLAGPAVNLMLAIGFLAYLWMTNQSFSLPIGVDGLIEFPRILFWANALLCLINLVPAFPMDGGRILRSLLAMFMDYSRATLIAGFLGRVLAVTCVGVGIWQFEVPLVIIGLFVFFAAEAEIGVIRRYEKENSPR